MCVPMCMCVHVCTSTHTCVHREGSTWVVDACARSAMTENYKLSDLGIKNPFSLGFGGCKSEIKMV